MPYISAQERSELDPLIEPLAAKLAERAAASNTESAYAGLLNYAVTTLTLALLQKRFGKLRYWLIATTTGVLHNAADEFYRRVGHTYEDAQIAKNGDLDGYRNFAEHAPPPESNAPLR
jgi:hypothetical protein